MAQGYTCRRSEQDQPYFLLKSVKVVCGPWRISPNLGGLELEPDDALFNASALLSRSIRSSLLEGEEKHYGKVRSALRDVGSLVYHTRILCVQNFPRIIRSSSATAHCPLQYSSSSAVISLLVHISLRLCMNCLDLLVERQS